MKCLKFLLLLLVICKSALCQNEKWVHASDWRLYNTFPRIVNDLAADSLRNFPAAHLDSETISQYLATASLLPKEKTAGIMWMSWYWVSYHLNHSIFILKVSNYGGFFLDETSGYYYQIPTEERKDWLNYFSHQTILLQGTKSESR